MALDRVKYASELQINIASLNLDPFLNIPAVLYNPPPPPRTYRTFTTRLTFTIGTTPLPSH